MMNMKLMMKKIRIKLQKPILYIIYYILYIIYYLNIFLFIDSGKLKPNSVIYNKKEVDIIILNVSAFLDLHLNTNNINKYNKIPKIIEYIIFSNLLFIIYNKIIFY